MTRLLLIVALLLFPGVAARAQVPAAAIAKLAAPAPAPAPAAPAAPILTPAQAQAVLDVLGNDAKRQQFIAVLQNMAKVQSAQAARANPLKLPPDSLGAALLVEASAGLGHASARLVATLRTLTDFPLFWRWITHVVDDPDSKARVTDAAWKLAVVVLAGGLAEYAARAGLSRLRDGLNRGHPHEDPANLAPEAVRAVGAHDDGERDLAGPDGDATRSGIAPVRPSNWALLRRVPYVLIRLLIDLVPIALFALVAYVLLLATPLGALSDTRVIVLGLVQPYLALRTAMAVVRMMLSPNSAALRLVHLSDASAAYLMRWLRRLLGLALFGYAIAQTGMLFGMYDAVRDALSKVIALGIHLCALVMVLQCRRRVARRLRPPAGAHGAWAATRSWFAGVWHIFAIFVIVATWIVFAFELRDGTASLWRSFAIAAAVLAVARLVSIVLLGALDRLLHVNTATLARYPGLDRQTARWQQPLHTLANIAIGAVAALVLLHLWGVDVTGWVRHGTLGARMAAALGTSAVTVMLAILVWEAINAGIQGHLARLARDAQLAKSARLRTLLPMLRTTLLVVIFIFAALMVLSQVGVNTAPLLAGAGVIGIAIGFGSQKLVQDVITGLFLLLENAMQVGDTVTLAGLSGTVENLSIRTIRLRALDGSVHIIPFSAVTAVTNSTRDYAYAVLDVTAGYNEEPDHIADVLRGVAAELRADARWGAAIEDDLDVMGVERFGDLSWVLRARVRVGATQRWAVQREFNRRLKYTFDAQAIESPFTSPAILCRVPPTPPDPALPAQPIAAAAAP